VQIYAYKHQNTFGGQALPGSLGELMRSPRIPSRSKGPTAKGKERAQMGKGRDEVEGRRSGKGGRGREGKFAFS